MFCCTINRRGEHRSPAGDHWSPLHFPFVQITNHLIRAFGNAKGEKMKKILALISVLLVAAIVFGIVQTVNVHNLKNEQKTLFDNNMTSVAESLREFKKVSQDWLYEQAMAELHSAASTSVLLQDEKEFEPMHRVLYSIYNQYLSNPKFPFYINRLLYAIEDYNEDGDLEKLTQNLTQIDEELTELAREEK